MDVPRLGMMIALSCLVAAPYPLLADGAAKGRGDTQAAGDRGAGRGTSGGGDGQARGNAPRRGTVVRSAPRAPTTARRGVSGRQVRAGNPPWPSSSPNRRKPVRRIRQSHPSPSGNPHLAPMQNRPPSNRCDRRRRRRGRGHHHAARFDSRLDHRPHRSMWTVSMWVLLRRPTGLRGD